VVLLEELEAERGQRALGPQLGLLASVAMHQAQTPAWVRRQLVVQLVVQLAWVPERAERVLVLEQRLEVLARVLGQRPEPWVAVVLPLEQQQVPEPP